MCSSADFKGGWSDSPVVPYFNVHGDADERVYPFLAYFTHRILASAGWRSQQNRLVIVPGGRHVPWGNATRDKLRPSIMAFLVSVMKLESC